MEMLFVKNVGDQNEWSESRKDDERPASAES
jgi:hypothetical protein